MLIIRKEQMAVFEWHTARRFREKVKKHLRRALAEPIAGIQDAALNERIEGGIKRGRAYGLTKERDLMLFIDLTFLIAPRFEDEPRMKWSRKILSATDVAGDAKMELIYQRLSRQQKPDDAASDNA